jgi:hypothetical protein
MTSTNPHDAGYEHNEDVAHEHSDINIRTVLSRHWRSPFRSRHGRLGRLLVLGTGGCQRSAVVAAGDPGRAAPPEPRSRRTSPRPEDVRERRNEGDQNCGWIDQKSGVAHNPIDEAMRRASCGDRRGEATAGRHAGPAYVSLTSGRAIESPPVSRQSPGRTADNGERRAERRAAREWKERRAQ